MGEGRESCAKPSEIFLLLLLLSPFCLCPLSIPRLQLPGSPSNPRRPRRDSASHYRQAGSKAVQMKASEASEGSSFLSSSASLSDSRPGASLHGSGTQHPELHTQPGKKEPRSRAEPRPGGGADLDLLLLPAQRPSALHRKVPGALNWTPDPGRLRPAASMARFLCSHRSGLHTCEAPTDTATQESWGQRSEVSALWPPGAPAGRCGLCGPAPSQTERRKVVPQPLRLPERCSAAAPRMNKSSAP